MIKEPIDFHFKHLTHISIYCFLIKLWAILSTNSFISKKIHKLKISRYSSVKLSRHKYYHFFFFQKLSENWESIYETWGDLKRLSPSCLCHQHSWKQFCHRRHLSHTISELIGQELNHVTSENLWPGSVQEHYHPDLSGWRPHCLILPSLSNTVFCNKG